MSGAAQQLKQTSILLSDYHLAVFVVARSSNCAARAHVISLPSAHTGKPRRQSCRHKHPALVAHTSLVGLLSMYLYSCLTLLVFSVSVRVEESELRKSFPQRGKWRRKRASVKEAITSFSMAVFFRKKTLASFFDLQAPTLNTWLLRFLASAALYRFGSAEESMRLFLPERRPVS